MWLRVFSVGFPLVMGFFSICIWLDSCFQNTGINHYNAGLAAQKQGDSKGAIAEYSQAITSGMHDADRADAYVERGILYRRSHQTDKARSDFSHAIALDSENDSAYFDRGLTGIDKGNYPDALRDFDHAGMLEPNDADVYKERAWIYVQQKQYDRALDQARQCRTHRGTLYPSVRKALVNVLAERARHEAITNLYSMALRDENEVIALAPQSAPFYRNRALIYGLLNNMEKAQADVQKFRALGGTASQVREVEATLHRLQAEYRRAATQKATPLQPPPPPPN